MRCVSALHHGFEGARVGAKVARSLLGAIKVAENSQRLILLKAGSGDWAAGRLDGIAILA